MCIDLTDVNTPTLKGCFLLPNIDQLVEATTSFEIMSFMGVYSRDHQIPMHYKDEERIEFITEEGIYYYTRIPFGLKNIGATYQRLVKNMFKDQIGRNMEVYMRTYW